MCAEENEKQDLKAFQAALGSLRPRADGLDSRWRDVLAKEAALSAAIASQPVEKPQPTGPLSLWERVKPIGPLSFWERVRVRAFRVNGLPPCTNPSGHRFLCIHCGNDAAPDGGPGRWAWPAALSTMTAVAAILFVMLATRSQPQVAVQRGERGTAIAASSGVPRQANPAAPERRATGDWLATGSEPRPSEGPDIDQTSYLTLRDQALRGGVESWEVPVSAVVTTARTTDAPLSYREQLNRLLEQQGLRGS